MASRQSPVGRPTRGTTGTNRLRRVDRWIAAHPALRTQPDPLVVDLGFGASAVTALELDARLRRATPGASVLGLEIDPARVARAQAQLADVRAGRTPFDPDAHVSFGLGGFEVPTPDARPATVIRAMNVLRQYDEHDVAVAWTRMARRLVPGGVLVDGTCDEIGRVCAWVAIDAGGEPVSLTLSLRLRSLDLPSVVAERLPKALIHRNVPGERVHALLADLDAAWTAHAALQTFGPSQRWVAAINDIRSSGRVLLGPRGRWRLGEATFAWAEVAPG